MRSAHLHRPPMLVAASLEPGSAPSAMMIGVISETHGLLRPEAWAFASAGYVRNVTDVLT